VNAWSRIDRARKRNMEESETGGKYCKDVSIGNTKTSILKSKRISNCVFPLLGHASEFVKGSQSPFKPRTMMLQRR